MPVKKVFIVSMDTYEDYCNKNRADAIWYGFYEEAYNRIIEEEISQTKNKLKM